MMCLKQENIFRWLDIEFLKTSACATLEVLDKYRYDTSSARYERKHVEVGIAG